LLGEVYVRERVRAADLDEDARPSRHSSEVPADELVLIRPHAVVVGAPGSGKTSMVQRLIHRSSQVWLKPTGGESALDRRLLRLVPVRIAASDLTVEGAFPDLLAKALTRQLGARLDTPLDPAMFIDGPAPGVDWLVCVDGLDEILDPARRRDVVQALRWRLVNRGPHRFLVTSRPLFLGELRPLHLAGAADCELLPFTDDQLSMFAERWFAARDRPAAAAEFLAQVRRSPILDLARVPLLATVAAVVHENRAAARLPITRAGLFEEFVRYLLYVRPAAVQSRDRLVTSLAGFGSRAETLAEWLFDHRRALLEHIAADHVSHDGADAAAAARDWMRQHAPAGIGGTPVGDSVILALLASTGILTADSGGRLRFTHRLLGEFLAAVPLALTLGPNLAGLNDSACFRRSDHADYERTVLTLASWAAMPGHRPELLWSRLDGDNTWQTLLAGRVAIETGEHVPALAERLLGQFGWCSLTDRGYRSDTSDIFGVLGGLMHHSGVAAKVQALAGAPLMHPARRSAALALLARYGHDEHAIDRIEELGRRSSAFGALCAADALIGAGAAARGLALLWDVLNHADLPAGWMVDAGESMRQAGYASDTVRLWKRWLSRHVPSDLEAHNLIVSLADLGETTIARRESLRLLENGTARLDARVFAAMFLSTTGEELPSDPDGPGERGRAFLRHTIGDPRQEVAHVVWISEAMVVRGIERDAAAAQLRRIRDTLGIPADSRFRAARGVAPLFPEDQVAAEALLTTPPADVSRTDQAWWQAALLADALGRGQEAARFRSTATQRISDSSVIRVIVEQLGDREPIAARDAILDVAARTDDEGVHYESVRLLLEQGWLEEAWDHVARHAMETGITSFWRNAIAGMTITAMPPDTARELARALADAMDPPDPDYAFWTATWAGLLEDLKPLPVVMARAERWPRTGT
jgi:hypothetical protein